MAKSLRNLLVIISDIINAAFAEHFNFKDLGDKWNYLIYIKELHIP